MLQKGRAVRSALFLWLCELMRISAVKLHFVQFWSNFVQCLAAGDPKYFDDGFTGLNGFIP